MNAHDFTDFWHHHTPHSLFYPAANQPPGKLLYEHLKTATHLKANQLCKRYLHAQLPN